LTNSTLTIEGGSYSFPGLTDIDSSNLSVEADASLTLPAVTSYTGRNNFATTTLEASGAHSVLSLPDLTSIAVQATYPEQVNVQASSGGDVSMPMLSQVSASLVVQSTGSGSVVDLSGLTDFSAQLDVYSSLGALTVTDQGTVLDPELTSLSIVSVTLDGTGTLATDQWTSLTSSTLTIEGGSYSFPGLTDIDSSNVSVEADASLTLPAVTSYTGRNNFATTTLQASGANSVLSLPDLTSIAVQATYPEQVNVQASSGGDVSLPMLTQVAASLVVQSTGSGSVVDLSALTDFSAQLDVYNTPGALTVTDQGIVLDPNLTTFSNVTITTDPTATFTVPANQTFSFPSGTTTINTGTVLDEGTLSVQSNAILNIKGGLTINGQGGLSAGTSTSVDVSGNLLGNTTNAAAFNPQGTVILDSAQGSTNPPQLLEAMSQDLGDVATGFVDNFAYGTLELTANTYVELVDQAANSPGSAPEAVYVNTLIVPAGATLNQDGLNIYAQTKQINGTIIAGGAIINGEVYNDVNDSGTLESGDPGLAGWTVSLVNTSTNSTYTTTTNASGLFSMTGIAAGTYTLSEVVQPGFVQTQPASPGTYTITVSSGQTVTGEDFGDHPTASIGREVFNDLNGDGTLENGEPGLSGWTVNLLNSSNTIIGTATTVTGGTYSFTSLLPGTYTVRVVSQFGYVASSAASVTVTDDNGQADTVNFGEFVPVTISGEVYSDATGAGLSGWTVDLVNSTQTVQTTTGSDGSFSFTNVGPGTYTVEAVQQAGYVASPGPLTETPTSGTNISGLELGESQTVAISGEVFNDLNDSGILNSNDPGLVGWTVNLVNGSDQIVKTAITDSNGEYSFTGVGPGTYTIADVLQPGFVQTAPASGSFTVTTASGVNVAAENFGALEAKLLSVTGLSVTPSNLQSGTDLVVRWNDTNAGNSPIAASFTDHVTITNTTTGQVLGVADIPFDVNTRGRIDAGATAAQQYAFQLPNGNPGVGNIEFTVTADDYDAISGGLSAAGRTASITVASTLADYADLAPSNISAPATAAPDQTVTVTWTDTNSGNAVTPAAWVDNILLSYDGTIANAVPVGTLAVTNPIAAGSSASEQASVTIPVTGPVSSGSLQFVIVANADQSFFELNTANNAAIDATATVVPLTLTLTSPVTSIAENAANPAILGTISRNGPTSQALTVSLSSSDTAQFTVPTTVTIPAGQSYAPVTITVLDDGIVDANQQNTITASASGFQDGSVAITDINTDQAALMLTIPDPSTPIPKGGFAIATVTLNQPSDQDLTVALTTNNPDRIYAPPTVTIPAGQTSATFDLRAIDDDLIEGNQMYAMTASAPGLTSSTLTFSVSDTDIPDLTLTLAQTTVSEADGSMATYGTVSRSFISDQPIVVALSVPAGAPVVVPTSVIIPANQPSITFPIGVFNNNSAQMIQSVPILAEVTTTATNVPLSQGSTSAMLDVVNANGPLLDVTFVNPVVTQGQASATTGTVTIENAPAPSSPLTVTLTTSDATEATVPATVTIAAGQTSVTFTIATPADTQDRGTVEPIIGASATNYAPGQAQLIVTDTNLSDLLVSKVSGPATALNNQLFSVSYTVSNQGSAPAVGPWQDQVYITDQPTGGALTPLGDPVDFNGTMPPGLSYSRTLTFFAPEETGNYWIVVQTNIGNTVTEALTTNDTAVSAQPMQVLPSYTATVQAAIPVAVVNTPIPLSGTATMAGGGPAQYQLVNIHIFTAGTERIISALTDQNGNFSTTFQPLPGEAGVYTIGATNPGVSQATVQGGFDIIGMSAQPPTASLSLIAGSSAVGGQVTLTNLTDIPLSDLQASVVGAPSNLDVTLTLGDGTPNQGLAGSGTLTLGYNASATDLSTPSGSFTIDVTSAEGATVDIPVSFTVIAQEPDVVASPSNLQAGMIPANQTVVQFTLTNQGGAASGPLQIDLPSNYSFLSLATPATIPSLDPGASTQITLLLTPTPELPLANYTGNIVVQGSSGNTIIPFSFINLSTSTGDLQITTVDEFTYYAQGSPNLAGANVTVTNSLTQQVAATGQTDANGLLDLPDLPEGYYEIHITANQHSSYDATVFVNPGITNTVTAFLSAQVVQYNFTVLPTQIPDQTQVQVNSVFQTNVPAPVIVVSPAVINFGNLNTVGQTEQINVTITNHGLIAAQGMTIGVPTHPYYSVTPLITNIGTLPADSSITIPVIITRIAVPDSTSLIDTTPGAVADPAYLVDPPIPCTLFIPIDWKLKCGPGDKYYSLEITVLNVQGYCPPGMPGGVPVFPVFPGGGTITITPTVSEPTPCSPLVAAVFNCIHDFLPFSDIAKCWSGMLQVLKGNPGGISVPGTILTCATAALKAAGTAFPLAGAAGQFTGALGEMIDQMKCVKEILAAYQSEFGGTDPPGGSAVATGGLSGAINQLQMYVNDFQSLADETMFIFGNSDWINLNTGANFDNWMTAFLQAATTPTNDPSPNGMNYVTANPISDDQAQQLENMTLPEGVSLADVQQFIARWNNTYKYNAAGIFDSTQLQSGQDPNFIAADLWTPYLEAGDAAKQQIQAAGFTDFPDAIDYAENQIYSIATLTQAAMGGVCATVKLQIDQTAVVTRQAFDATLEIDNSDMMPLTNIGLQVIVHDANGNDVTNLFVIQGPTLNGLTDVNGNGMLAMNTDGSATYTLVPTDAAAPNVATTYYVSAVLNYTDDGMDLTIPFAASSITVEPNPSLTLRYFMQRDVYGPDPTNPSAPSEPFALGVQILNTGAGTANNVELTSAQPEIVDNEKGLLVNFQIIGTQVDGQNLSPSLTANFGDIAPGGVSTAVFLLESSIQGQFIDFSASYQDISGLGNPQASIINGIQIYELIHLAQGLSPADAGETDFLVDTIPNPLGTPDTIYLADGSSAPVAQATDPSFDSSPGPGNLTIHLTDTPTSGWDYLDVPDPGNGNYRLVSVTRSDGVALPANDFWETDRTFVGGGVQPIYENDLHLLDDNGTGSYTLVYVPINQTQPTITSISAVSPNPAITPVDGLQVTFSQPIALGTLDENDLSLTLNGGPNLIALPSDVTVSLVSGSTYQISGLSALDGAAGAYTLTVDAGGVEDTLGNPGTGTASTSWVMAASSPAVATIGGVAPGPRNTPVGSVSVTFTEPINPSSFGLTALDLTEDGGSNLITSGSGVSITQEGPATFQVNGLSALTTTDGNYVLTVEGSQVIDPNGNPGVGSDSVAWTMDTKAPIVQSFSTITSPRNTPVGSIDVTFSKPIDPTTFTDSALSLTGNGGSNLINGGVSVALVSGSTYEISGLSALDAAEGAYLLTVNGADVSDLAGNAGTNSLSTSWVMDTAVPAAPTDLAISPNTGVSPGLTDTGAVTLTGSLGATGLTVDVFDATTDTNLGAATVSGTSFSMALNLGAGTNQLLVTAEDAAGNISPASTFNAFIDLTAPEVSSIGGASPNPRNTPVSTIDVDFNKQIDLATFTPSDLTLSDNGGPNLITSTVTISLVSGSTYQIGGLAGLTKAEGNYTLTVNAAGIQDPSGNLGSGTLSTSWLMDTTPPTSHVNALPKRGTSLSFAVSVTGSDPNGANGSPPSGVASYDIYASTNGGPWSLWTTVPSSNPTATFTGQSNTTYSLYSIAHDLAGNTESKQPAIEASTYLPDLTPPVTSVDGTTGANPSTVNTATGTFTLNVTGSDPGGGLVTYFEVFASVDGGAYQEVGPYAIPAGAADSKGNYHSTMIYQGLTDGQAHTYSFYCIGLDAAGHLQIAPSGPNVTFANQVFAQPGQLQVIGFTVEHGSPSRSYVRYLDLGFNESDSQSGGELTSIVNSMSTSSPDILIYKYDLNGDASSKTAVPLSSPTMFAVIDHAIEIDFGSGGIGGNPNTTATDGYYEVDIKLPSGQTSVHHFYRLLGDVAGDGIVDENDLNEIAASIGENSQLGWTPLSADVTGAGSVTAIDLTLATRSKGRKLGSGLSLG